MGRSKVDEQDKSETLHVRIKPGVKDLLAEVARDENRSYGNMIETMIKDYAKQHK